METFNETGMIRGKFAESNILENQRTRELFLSLRPVPQFELPKFFFGFQKRPTNTTPDAWRETFFVEHDKATDDHAKKTFLNVIKMIDIAKECGAIKMVFGLKSELSLSGGHIKTLYLDDILFHKKSMTEDWTNFSHRLSELDS